MRDYFLMGEVKWVPHSVDRFASHENAELPLLGVEAPLSLPHGFPPLFGRWFLSGVSEIPMDTDVFCLGNYQGALFGSPNFRSGVIFLRILCYVWSLHPIFFIKGLELTWCVFCLRTLNVFWCIGHSAWLYFGMHLDPLFNGPVGLASFFQEGPLGLSRRGFCSGDFSCRFLFVSVIFNFFRFFLARCSSASCWEFWQFSR